MLGGLALLSFLAAYGVTKLRNAREPARTPAQPAAPKAVAAAPAIDESPLAVAPERAFPELKIARPVVLTHAGDGSNRVFVATPGDGSPGLAVKQAPPWIHRLGPDAPMSPERARMSSNELCALRSCSAAAELTERCFKPPI